MRRNRRQPSSSTSTTAGSYTIDALAAAAGLPTRTVRLYQSIGVLHRPQRQGRIAVYSEAHLERLRLIAQLQDRGLRLRAVRDALRHAERGQLLFEDWFGLGEHLRLPWSGETPTLLREAEVQQRVGDRPAGVVAALVRADLLRRQGAGLPAMYVVPSPGLLDIGLKLYDAGVDVETGAEAAGLLRKRMRRAAQDLLRHFVKRTGRGFGRSRSASDVGEALGALRALGAEAVRLLFAQEMERTLRSAIERGEIPAPERRA